MEKYEIVTILDRRYQRVVLFPGERFLTGDLNLSPHRNLKEMIDSIKNISYLRAYELTEHEVDRDWHKGYPVLRRVLELEMNEFGEVSP